MPGAYFPTQLLTQRLLNISARFGACLRFCNPGSTWLKSILLICSWTIWRRVLQALQEVLSGLHHALIKVRHLFSVLP